MYIKSKLRERDLVVFEKNLALENTGENFNRQLIQIKAPGLEVAGNLHFNSNIFIAEISIASEQSLTDVIELQGAFLQLSYLIKGETTLSNQTHSKYKLDPGNLQLCYQKESRNIYKSPAGAKTTYKLFLISAQYYIGLLKPEKWSLGSKLFQKIKEDQNIPFGEQTFSIDFTLYHILSSLTKWSEEGGNHVYLIDLKIKELFLMLHIYEGRQEQQVEGLHPELIKKLKNARAYLGVNYKNSPTVKQLARQVLLNELQLKKGFKKMYGTTIRAYLIEIRMKKALLLLKEYKVNEVAGLLGYQSVPHFITSFKKFHGATPKQLFRD